MQASQVETLHAEIDELSASIAKLTQDITDLQAEIAESDKAHHFCFRPPL